MSGVRAGVQALLAELSALGSSELRAWVAAHRPRLTFSFLSWLADRRACALPALCSVLLCARVCGHLLWQGCVCADWQRPTPSTHAFKLLYQACQSAVIFQQWGRARQGGGGVRWL